MPTARHSSCKPPLQRNHYCSPRRTRLTYTTSGLGVGTTPSALIHHGIETTIVEIDPVVHKFATEYFHLPSNHIAVIEDATTFVQRTPPAQYDYIVHDVFTGGAEPLELFTLEFLENVGALLKDDGVIAIVSPLPHPTPPKLTHPRTTPATSLSTRPP